MSNAPEKDTFSKENPLRRKVATSQLDSYLDRYIASALRLKRFQDVSSPEIFIKMENDIKIKSEKNIDFLAHVVGGSPKDILKRRVQGLLRNMDDKYYVYGGSENLKREDRVPLLELLERISQEDFNLTESGKDEVKQFEDTIRAIEKLPKLDSQFLVGENEHKPGEWISISPDTERDDLITINVPLKAGRKIVISFPEFNESMCPKEEISSENSSIPWTNGAFYQETGQSDSIRLITCLEQTPFLEAKIGKVSKNISGQRIEPNLKEETLERLRNIFATESGIDFKNIKDMSAARLLKRVMDFVGNKVSGEKTEEEQDSNIEYLIGLLEHEKLFPGTCKSISSITVGFLRALGFEARILQGRVVNTESGFGGGHVWPEVYLPTLKQYVPIDPSMGAFLTYPSVDTYFMKGDIHPGDKPIRIKVTFKDSTRQRPNR